MLATLRQMSPVRLALLSLLALTGFRLWYSLQFDLVADEAYYWLWAKHPAASYRDKGPLVAWTIALGTKIFDDTVFGIRFFAVILSSATAWLIFVFARQLYNERVALWCLLVAIIMPLFAVGSILMTIDSLSVPLWALAAFIFWRILQTNRTIDWFWLGLTIGAGFLAKFTNGVQFACIGLFLLWSKEHRRLLVSWNMVVACAAFLIAITPVIWWNIQTGWVHAIALHTRSGVKSSFSIHPLEFLRFVGEVFGVISPLIFAGMIVAAVALLRHNHRDLRARFLLSQCLPVFALFLFFSLNKAGKSNWIAPALITGVIFMVVFWQELVARKPAWRYGVMAALGVAGLMTLGLHITDLLRLPLKLDIMHRARGWNDFGKRVQEAREKNQATVLVGSHYSVSSMMAFYLPDRPTTYMPPSTYGSSQFSLWPPYEVQPTTRALFVAWKPSVPATLTNQFSNIQLVEDFWTQHKGRPMNRVCVYLCTP